MSCKIRSSGFKSKIRVCVSFTIRTCPTFKVAKIMHISKNVVRWLYNTAIAVFSTIGGKKGSVLNAHK